MFSQYDLHLCLGFVFDWIDKVFNVGDNEVHENLLIKGTLHGKAMRHYRLPYCCGLSLILSAERESKVVWT